MKNKSLIQNVLYGIKAHLGNINLYMKDLNELNLELSKLKKKVVKLDLILKQEQDTSTYKKSK